MALAGGCALFQREAPNRNSEPTTTTRNLGPDSGAYALLFDLLGDEKDVAKIRFIKRPRPEVTALLKEISQVCGDAHKRLEQFAKADKELDLKDMNLPAGEVVTRKSISKAKQKTLLGSTGKDLEIQLLLTQQEAMNYGAHLAKTAAVWEKRPDRKEFLEQLSAGLTRLAANVVSLLSEHYQFPEK